MTNKRLDPNAPSRSVTDVGAGDYVKIGSSWERIEHNSAAGAANGQEAYPWTVRTESGRSYGGMSINRYAKAEDLIDR
jgi:hypothetical protein